MQVLYIIDQDYSPDTLAGLFDKAREAGVTDVVVYIPAFTEEHYVASVKGVTMRGNHLFDYSSLKGTIVTKQTIKSTRQSLGFVVAVGIDTSNLQFLEDRKGVQGVVVINDNLSNIDEWLKLYDAIDIVSGQTRMQGMQVAPLLNRAIGWLKHIAECNTPLYDFKRDDYLRVAANLLRRNQVSYTEDVVAAQCIKRGLDARSSRAVASVFGKGLQVHGDLPIKVGKPDYEKMLETVDNPEFDNN